jgi:hypothetical protein
MNTLTVYVYKNPLADCTNGGISGSARSLNLIMSDDEKSRPVVRSGSEDIRYFREQAAMCADHNPEKDVFIVKRFIGGRDYFHIEPVAPTKKGNVGYMAGGNLGFTRDGRYGFDYALSIHDRQETQEQYDMNE